MSEELNERVNTLEREVKRLMDILRQHIPELNTIEEQQQAYDDALVNGGLRASWFGDKQQQMAAIYLYSKPDLMKKRVANGHYHTHLFAYAHSGKGMTLEFGGWMVEVLIEHRGNVNHALHQVREHINKEEEYYTATTAKELYKHMMKIVLRCGGEVDEEYHQLYRDLLAGEISGGFTCLCGVLHENLQEVADCIGRLQNN